MAKVIGVMLTIWGGLATLGVLFLYQNSNAHLQYNPADAPSGLLDVGLLLPAVMFGIMFIAGIVLLKVSKEPNLN